MDNPFSPATYALLKKLNKTEIDAWLAAHVDPETGYVLDDSLTLENAAAQAKAVGDALALKAPLASAELTGTPTAPTPAAGDSSTKIATTAFIQGEIATESAALEQMILASFPTDSTSNQPVASFADGADGIPVKALTVSIVPVQSGSGNPSPDNVRPISGWTGANIFRQGINIFGGTLSPGKLRDSDGVYQNYAGWRCTQTYIPVKPNMSVCFANDKSYTGDVQVYFYDKDKTYLGFSAGGASPVYWHFGEAVSFAGFTYSSKIAFCRFAFGTDDAPDGMNVSVNIPHTDSTYHAYSGTTYPVSWQDEAGTVYGGTLDVTTGLLTATHKGVNMGDLSWTKYTSGDSWCFYADLAGAKTYAANASPDWMCSAYIKGSATSLASACSSANVYHVLPRTSNATAMINNPDYSDATAFTNAVKNQTLVYDLAAPVTYQLTPTEVKTLLGANNIFADCGDIVSLDYRADTTLYIAKKIAEATA